MDEGEWRFWRSAFYPGMNATDEADILISVCAVLENPVYLPLVMR